MSKLNHLLRAAASIASVAAATVATPATASPPSGVTPTNYSTVTLGPDFQANNDRIKLQTKDESVVRVQKLEFAPGGYTGFHYHPGIVVVSVASGTVTLVDSGTCETKDYGPGSPNGSIFIEADDHSHQATSAGGATVFVTYIVPSNNGSPSFRVEQPVPFCAQSGF